MLSGVHLAFSSRAVAATAVIQYPIAKYFLVVVLTHSLVSNDPQLPDVNRKPNLF